MLSFSVLHIFFPSFRLLSQIWRVRECDGKKSENEKKGEQKKSAKSNKQKDLEMSRKKIFIKKFLLRSFLTILCFPHAAYQCKHLRWEEELGGISSGRARWRGLAREWWSVEVSIDQGNFHYLLFLVYVNTNREKKRMKKRWESKSSQSKQRSKVFKTKTTFVLFCESFALFSLYKWIRNTIGGARKKT